jgi:hypothetical protein
MNVMGSGSIVVVGLNLRELYRRGICAARIAAGHASGKGYTTRVWGIRVWERGIKHVRE